MLKRKDYIVVISIGLVCLILGIVFGLIIIKSPNKKEVLKFNIQEATLEGEEIDTSADELKELRLKDYCFKDNNTERANKYCISILKNYTDESLNFDSVSSNNEDLYITGTNTKVYNETIEDIINDNINLYEDVGYETHNYRKAIYELNDYQIDVLLFTYANKINNNYRSKLIYVIKDNDNYIKMEYAIYGQAFSDYIVSRIVSNITIKEHAATYTKSEKDKDNLVANIKIVSEYIETEVDGVKSISKREEDEKDTKYNIKIEVPENKYKEIIEYDDNIIRFENNNYNLAIDIIQTVSSYEYILEGVKYYQKDMELIEFNNNYSINDIIFNRALYIIGDNKYIEYAYQYENGIIIRYSFEADKDYEFDYKDIESNIVFDITKEKR